MSNAVRIVVIIACVVVLFYLVINFAQGFVD